MRHFRRNEARNRSANGVGSGRAKLRGFCGRCECLESRMMLSASPGGMSGYQGYGALQMPQMAGAPHSDFAYVSTQPTAVYSAPQGLEAGPGPFIARDLRHGSVSPVEAVVVFVDMRYGDVLIVRSAPPQ